MPLTESFKRKNFGKTEPQQMRDYSGAGNTLLYEGYAAPGISTATSGWVIIKHGLDGNGLDNQSQPKIGVSWDARTSYSYSSP